MAITGIEYEIFRALREQGGLPVGGSMLELGEANWYADVPLQTLAEDIRTFAREEDRDRLSASLAGIQDIHQFAEAFLAADIFWQTFMQYREKVSVDPGGTDKALKIDLNHPLHLERQFDAVFNLGTTEHVFNIAQAFKTIHECTVPGGIMLHGLPFSGWVDHGFFNFNPTFYWDLAAANGYAIALAIHAELMPLKLTQIVQREQIHDMVRSNSLGKNSLMYVLLRKAASDSAFTIPLQGYYAGTISKESVNAWKDLR